jgi:hypothetical protein
MVIWYNVISENFFNINFDVVFKHIKDIVKSDDLELIKDDFINNIEGYIWNIYGAHDFIEEDNEYAVHIIIEKWEEYIKNKQNENI